MCEETETIILGQGVVTVELNRLLLVLAKNRGIIYNRAFEFVESRLEGEHGYVGLNNRIKLTINQSEQKMFLYFPMVFQVKENSEDSITYTTLSQEEALSLMATETYSLFDKNITKSEIKTYVSENFKTIFSVDYEY